MRLLKILFVQDRPQTLGGAVLYMNALRRYLEERGHTCEILGFPEEGPPPGRHEIRVPRKPRGSLARKIVTKMDWDFHLYRKLRNAFGRLRPDIVHIHNYSAGGNAVLLACSGIPTVHTVHDLNLLCPRSGRSLDPRGDLCLGHFGLACVRRGCMPFRVFLEHALFRESVKRYALRSRVDRLIVHSRLLAERLEACGLRPLCLPRFVDLEAFPFVPMEGHGRRLLFVGYLDESKGVEPLLQAFRRVRQRLPRAQLDIVGDGPAGGELRKRRVGMEEGVRFHGEIPHEDVPAFYQRSHVVAVPSQIPETGPFTALEAMSTGRPVVGSNVGGIVEVVQDGRTGFLVEPSDTEGLAERIGWLLENPSEASRMGVEGRRRAEEMSLEDPFPRIESLYHALARSRGRAIGRSSDP